jgi:hypothetical protein
MSRIVRMLVAATAAGGLGVFGLMTAGAASAGTYTSGAWTLTAPSTDTYSAQVQQPINANGSSVFNHKSSTIPVQFKVTDTRSFAFESIVTGSSGITPTSDNGFSVASFTTPSGLTVGAIGNLTADFTWLDGTYNHSGGFRWSIVTPDGNIFVDYGDASTSLQGGTAGSGVNMTTLTDNRVEGAQLGHSSPFYDTWANVLAASAPGGTGTIADEPVSEVDLVVDGGWGGDQVLNLTDATVGYTGGSSMFAMPASITTQTNSAPAYLYLLKNSDATPPAQIDETTLTSTQGDSGGQFRQVDGKYIYNLPVSNLPDKTASYTVGISFNPDGSSPVPATVMFGLK